MAPSRSSEPQRWMVVGEMHWVSILQHTGDREVGARLSWEIEAVWPQVGHGKAE